MEICYSQRSSSTNPSIKQMLISNFLKKNSEKALKLPLPCLVTPKVDLNSSSIDMSSNILNKSLDQSRPNSACSIKSFIFNSSFIKESIPEDFSNSINAISLKNIKQFTRATNNNNLECLVYSFLIIFVCVGRNSEYLAGIKLIRTKSLGIFKKFISVPGNFIKNLRIIPKILKEKKKISAAEIKKSLAWFNMVNAEGIGSFKTIYELMIQIFNYSEQFYDNVIVFKADNNRILGSNSGRGEKNAKNLPRNHGKCDTRKLCEKNNGIIEEIDENRNEIIENNENCENLIKNNEKEVKIDKFFKVKQAIDNKSSKFLAKSRIMQRIYEKLLIFLRSKPRNTEIGTEDKTQKLKLMIKEFIEIPQNEITQEIAKYLDSLITSKELLKYL